MRTSFRSHRRVRVADVMPALLEVQKRYNLSYAEWSRASGVERQNVRFVMIQRNEFMYEGTFLAMTKLPYLDKAKVIVAPTASVLRLQAGAAIGWGQDWMRLMIPNVMGPSNLAKQQYVQLDTAEQVIGYVEKAMVDPRPDTFGAKRAQARGWLPPERYDSDLFLDPMWDGVGGLLDEEPPMIGRELWEEFLFLRSAGLNEKDALKAVNQDAHWITKYNRKYGGYRDRAPRS